MNKPRSRSGGGNQLNPLRRYLDRVNMMHNPNLIGYWPMDEPSGSVALDYSGRGLNGVYTTVALGKEGIGDGRACPSFDGSASFNNIYSAALAAAFNNQELTLMAWGKVSGVGVWTDGTDRRLISLQADGNNRVFLQRSTNNNELRAFYTAGATAKSAAVAASMLDFFCLAVTVSKSADQLILYLNGVPGTPITGLGVWAGALASTTVEIGAASTTPGAVWSGLLAHGAVWTMALSQREVTALSERNAAWAA